MLVDCMKLFLRFKLDSVEVFYNVLIFDLQRFDPRICLF